MTCTKTKNRFCSVDGCDKKKERRDLCQMHAWRLQHYGDVHYKNVRSCSVAGCERQYAKNGYCGMHWQRVKRAGTTDDPTPREPAKGRYSARSVAGHFIAPPNGRVYLHRLVLFEKIGRGPHPCHWCGMNVYWKKTYPEHHNALIADHLDHNRSNNRPKNPVPACNGCNARRRVGGGTWKRYTQ